jgi:hypothetical protein
MRGGNYILSTARIMPVNSGTLANRITYKAYGAEAPDFTSGSADYHVIKLVGRTYIVVDGISGTDIPAVAWFEDSHYNELKNCDFHIGNYTNNGINIFDFWGAGAGPSTHNWVHHNTFSSNRWADLLQISTAPGYGSALSEHNTVEDNTIYHAAHCLVSTFAKYTVIKNNVLHNEGWYTPSGTPTYTPDYNGLYGGRVLDLYDGRSKSDMHCLVEGNRFPSSGAPPDSDGGECITLTSKSNIIRFNALVNAQNNGMLMKSMTNSVALNNRIYNNTIVWAGRWANSPQWQGYGIRYPNWNMDEWPAGNVIKNNILYGNAGGDILNYGGSEGRNTHENNWLTADGNPLFVDPTHADLTSAVLPDLHLQAGSPCKNAGTHLTHAAGAGSGVTTLVVLDALYFQDGTWGSALTHGVTLFPDWIAIGTVGNVVAISSIDYATNTITLASPMTWTDNAPIWLYKNSSGVRVLYGSAPPLGANAVVE